MLRKFIWLLARLKAMSLGELLWRLRNASNKQIYRISYLGITSDDDIDIQLPTKIESIMGERIFDEKYRINYPFDILDTSIYAEKILSHKLDLFELKNVRLGNRIDWHLDYKTGRSWPRKYALSINWRKSDIGGIKYVWEVNRHQYIVALAKAFFLTGNKKYGDKSLNLFVDWVEKNRPLEGINWNSPLEVSVRLISWTFVLHFLWDMLDLADGRLQKIVRSLIAQARFVEKNLSKYSSANNHRLGEVAGLAVLGLGLHGLPEASRWSERGLAILEEEILLQIHEDGVGKEQAIGYLCFILDLALVAFAFARFRGRVIREMVWQRIETACEFLVAAGGNSKTLPRIGDDDDAYAIRFDDSIDNARSVVGTVGVIRDRKNFLVWSDPLPEKIFWLAGPKLPKREEYVQAYSKEREESNSSIAFENGGYYIMKNQINNKAISGIVDCGELGYLSIAAHGHADCLSFMLRLGSEFLLVDPGTYLYESGGRWRDYFKSTRAHNTITVDGKNQSVSVGTFLWARKAKSHRELWSTKDEIDIFVGSHDGYTRLRSPVVHRRGILFLKPNIFILIDGLESKGQHNYEQLFHLHPDISVDRISDQHWVLKGRTVCSCLFLWPTDGHLVKALKGAEKPILGWYSPSFGVKQPSTTISNSFDHHGNSTLLALVGVDLENVDCNPSIVDASIVLKIRSSEQECVIRLSDNLTSPLPTINKADSAALIGEITWSEGKSLEVLTKNPT